MTETARPLAGRRIVVTRAADQAGELADAIAAAGGSVISLPLLEIVDVDDPATVAERLAELDADDWLVVTSPNVAARVVAHVPSPERRPYLAVVGPTTAETFRSCGWAPDLVPVESNARSLVAEFPAPNGQSGRVLVVQGDLARPTVVDGLGAAGWQVDQVVAYRNVMPELDDDVAAEAASADAVVFASPTAVRRFVEHIGRRPSTAVCIGPVSGDAARKHSFDVVVSESTAIEDIVSALSP